MVHVSAVVQFAVTEHSILAYVLALREVMAELNPTT
jgi:hypothetical protein